MPIKNDVESHDRNLVYSQKTDLTDSHNRPLRLQGSDDVPYPIPTESIDSIERRFLYETTLFEEIPWKSIFSLLQETIVLFVFTLLPSFFLYNAVDCKKYSILNQKINTDPDNLNAIMEFIRWSVFFAAANVIYFFSYLASKIIPPIIITIIERLTTISPSKPAPLSTRRFNLIIKQTSQRLKMCIWSFMMVLTISFLIRKIELKDIDNVPFDTIFFVERGLATLTVLFFLLFCSEAFSLSLRQSSLRGCFGRRVQTSNAKYRLYGKIMTIFNQRPNIAHPSKTEEKYTKKLNNKLLQLIPNHDNEHGLALHGPSDAAEMAKLIFIGASLATEDTVDWEEKRLSVDAVLPLLSEGEKDLLIAMLFPLYDADADDCGDDDSEGVVLDGGDNATTTTATQNTKSSPNSKDIVDNEFKYISFTALERCLRHISLERDRIRVALIQSIRVQDQLGSIINAISIGCTILFMARAMNMGKSTIFMLLGISYASIQFATLSLLQFMYECCIFIQVSRPFDCGDRVQISSYSGELLLVEQFNLYTTTFRRCSDGSLLYMANNIIRNQKLIVNHRRTMNCWESFLISRKANEEGGGMAGSDANAFLAQLLLALKTQDPTEFTGNGWLERRSDLGILVRIEFRNNFQDNSWKLRREQKINSVIQQMLKDE